MVSATGFLLFFTFLQLPSAVVGIHNDTVSSTKNVTMTISGYLPDVNMVSAEVNIRDGKGKKLAAKHPILVILSGPHSIVSWTVPLKYEGNLQFDSNKPLCRNSEDFSLYSKDLYGQKKHRNSSSVYLTITTQSVELIDFEWDLKLQTNVFMSLNHDLKPSQFNPSHPLVVMIDFNGTESDLELTIESQMHSTHKKNKSLVDTGNICAVALLQPDDCPIRDEEKMVVGSTKHLAFLHSGRMRIPHNLATQSNYLALVILSLPNNSRCGSSRLSSSIIDKTVKLTLTTVPAVKTYVMPVAVIVACVLALIIIGLLPSLCPALQRKLFGRPAAHEVLVNDEEPIDPEEEQQSGDDLQLSGSHGNLILTGDCIWHDVGKKGRTVASLPSMMVGYKFVPDQIGFSVVIVAVGFLVFTKYHEFHTDGNEDVCFYNSGCLRSLGDAPAFNTIASSFGYFLFGLAFLGEMLYRRWKCNANKQRDDVVDRTSSTAQTGGLNHHHDVTLGLSGTIIAIGVFNALLGQCPNRQGFHVEICFATIAFLLVILMLFSARHEPANTFVVHLWFTAVAIWSAVGVSTHNHVALFAVVGCLICLFSLYLLLQIYFGRQIFPESAFVPFLQTMSVLKKSFTSEVHHGHKKPFFMLRSVLLCAMFIVQLITLIVAAQYLNVSHWLMLIAEVFSISYLLYYVVMKLHFGEKLSGLALVNALLAFIFLLLSIVLLAFIRPLSNMEVSAAEYRQLEFNCVFAGFLDLRHLWHLTLSAAIYFMAKTVTVIDDDLWKTSREEIYIF